MKGERDRLIIEINNLQVRWHALEKQKTDYEARDSPDLMPKQKAQLAKERNDILDELASVRRRLRDRENRLIELQQRDTVANHPWTAVLNETVGVWVFGGALLIFFAAVVFFTPSALPEFKQRLLAVCAALLAGLFGFFLAGRLSFKLDSIETRWGKFRLQAAGGFALMVFVLVWWSSPLAPVGTEVSTYVVRVTVLDSQQMPVEDATVWSSIGGEPKRVAGGWEFEIPAANKPADDRFIVYAGKPHAFLRGQSEVTLQDRPHVATQVQLKKRSNALVEGIVQDSAGQRLGGVRVSIYGKPDLWVATDATGHFRLPTHSAAGELVRLHVEKEGYQPVDQYHRAGATPVTIVVAMP